MKQLAVLFFLAACSNPAQNGYNRFLADCNRVDIVVYNDSDTLFFNTEDSTGIRILKNNITGSGNVKDTCAAQGVLRFRHDSTLLLEAPFAVTPGNNEADCNYLAYTYNDNSYAHSLTGRARNLLGTVIQQAGK